MGTFTMNAPQLTFAPTRRKEEPIMADFVEQKVFSAEIKRIDSEIVNIKKAEEKQDKTTFDVIKSLKDDVNRRFEAVDRRFESVEKQLDAVRADIGDLRRLFITLSLTGLGVTLAAFYGFASYIRG